MFNGIKRSLGCLALYFFALAVSPLAGAQTVIEDPNHVLDQVDQFVSPSTPFAEAFACGQVASFDHGPSQCTFGCGVSLGIENCWVQCVGGETVATHTVSQCTADHISIFSDDAENTDYSSLEYSTLHGDLVRKFMANLSTYISSSGKLVLSDAVPVTFTLVPGAPGSPAYSALNVNGTFILDGHSSGLSVIFTVLKGVPGVAQVARFRIGDETWFRLKTVGAGN